MTVAGESSRLHLAPAQDQAPLSEICYQAWNAEGSRPSALFFLGAGEYLIRFPDIADFRISAATGDVVCTPVVGAAERWRTVFEQQVVPLLASLHGVPVYHGAAVAIGNFAIAFLGVSGRGKSTLTAAFAGRGYPFLTDDCLRLTDVDGVATVQPDVASIRLWDDSIEALAPPTLTARHALGSPKAHLPAADVLPHCTQSLPLRRVYVLQDGDELDAPVLSPLSHAEMAMAWTRNAFVLDIKSPVVLRRNLERAATLAKHVVGRGLAYPRRYDMLDVVIDAVVADTLAGAAS